MFAVQSATKISVCCQSAADSFVCIVILSACTHLRSQALASEIVALEERHRSTRAAELRLGKEAASLRESLEDARRQLQRGQVWSVVCCVLCVAQQCRVLTVPTALCVRAAHLLQQAKRGQAPAPVAQEQGTQTDVLPVASPEVDVPPNDEAANDAAVNVSGRITQRAVTRAKQAVLEDLASPSDGGKKLLERLPPRVLEMLPSALLAGGADEGVSTAIIQSVQSIDALLFGVEADKRRLLDAVRSLQAEVAGLTTANEVLRHKLEAQTQRMELAVQQAMLHGSVPVLPDGGSVANGQGAVRSGGIKSMVCDTWCVQEGLRMGLQRPRPRPHLPRAQRHRGEALLGGCLVDSDFYRPYTLINHSNTRIVSDPLSAAQRHPLRAHPLR